MEFPLTPTTSIYNFPCATEPKLGVCWLGPADPTEFHAGNIVPSNRKPVVNVCPICRPSLFEKNFPALFVSCPRITRDVEPNLFSSGQ